MKNHGLCGLLVAASAILATALPSQAVILYSSSTTNTTDPGDNSGYQLTGRWINPSPGVYNGAGVPIGPNHFITARHLGGGVGSVFNFQGVDYTATAVYNEGVNSDLRIVEVSGTFPYWAELYRDTGNEIGQTMTVTGLNRFQRGTLVTQAGDDKGWTASNTGGSNVLTWGRNVVTGFQGNLTNNIRSTATAGNSNLLYFNFDESGITNEAQTTNFDSGGGVFIQDGGVWKLAGINFASRVAPLFIDTYDVMPALYTSPGVLVGGAISGAGHFFDIRDLYVYDGVNYYLTQDVLPPVVGNIPTAGYASRISTSLSWIDSIVPPQEVPEPASFMLLVAGAGVLLCRRR